MTKLKGITVAEKLRLAQAAGVVFPHLTNTANPIDFPAHMTNENIKYSEKYDAHYDSNTNEWTEDKCDDPECEFCTVRPDQPLNTQSGPEL